MAPRHGATPQEQLLGKVEDCPSIQRTVQYSTVRSVVRVKPTTFKSKPADRLTVGGTAVLERRRRIFLHPRCLSGALEERTGMVPCCVYYRAVINVCKGLRPSEFTGGPPLIWITLIVGSVGQYRREEWREHRHARTHARADTYTRTHARTRTHACTHEDTHARTRTHEGAHARTRTRMHVSTHARTHARTHKHTRVHGSLTRVRVCVCACVCVCVLSLIHI